MPFSLPDPPPPPCELCTVFMVSVWYFDHNAAVIPYRRKQWCAVCNAKTPCRTPKTISLRSGRRCRVHSNYRWPATEFRRERARTVPPKSEKYNVTHYSTAMRVRWFHLENSTSTGKDEKYLWPLVDFHPTDLMCFAIGLPTSKNNRSTKRRDSRSNGKMNTGDRWLDPASTHYIIHNNFSIKISNNIRLFDVY